MEKIKVTDLRMISMKVITSKLISIGIPVFKYLIKTEKDKYHIMTSTTDLINTGKNKMRNFFITKNDQNKNIVKCSLESYGIFVCSYRVTKVSKEKALEILISL